MLCLTMWSSYSINHNRKTNSDLCLGCECAVSGVTILTIEKGKKEHAFESTSPDMLTACLSQLG